MIIPGLVSATFKTESPDFVLAALKKADLHAVEWSENWHIPAGDTALARDLRERTLAQGAEVAAYGSYYRLGQNSNPAKDFCPRCRALRHWVPRSFASGAAVQHRQSWMQTHAGSWRSRQGSSVIWRHRRASRSPWKWTQNTVTDTNESGLSFLDEAAAENLYCLWQPTVALNMDERCAGLDMLEARGRLLNLHVYYWLEGKRRPFAEGLDEWRRYLQHVNRNEKRYGLLEFVLDNTEEQFLEDAAQWKRLLQETAMN